MPHPTTSDLLSIRVTPHSAPAAQQRAAGNIGNVSQYINKGEVARLAPEIKPAKGLRPISLQNSIINTPARKQVKRDKAVINRHGLSVLRAINHESG